MTNLVLKIVAAIVDKGVTLLLTDKHRVTLCRENPITAGLWTIAISMRDDQHQYPDHKDVSVILFMLSQILPSPIGEIRNVEGYPCTSVAIAGSSPLQSQPPSATAPSDN